MTQLQQATQDPQEAEERGPDASPMDAGPPLEEISEPMAAYLVYLLRTDIAAWDDNRELAKKEAVAFMGRLADCLNPELRRKVYAMRLKTAA
jgi:hypothetical protein